MLVLNTMYFDHYVVFIRLLRTLYILLREFTFRYLPLVIAFVVVWEVAFPVVAVIWFSVNWWNVDTHIVLSTKTLIFI
jgi:hypothetical protein